MLNNITIDKQAKYKWQSCATLSVSVLPSKKETKSKRNKHKAGTFIGHNKDLKYIVQQTFLTPY